MQQYLAGDDYVLGLLFEQNKGLFYKIANNTIDKFQRPRNQLPKDIVEEICAEMRFAFVTLLCQKKYCESRAKLTTYIYPYLLHAAAAALLAYCKYSDPLYYMGNIARDTDKASASEADHWVHVYQMGQSVEAQFFQKMTMEQLEHGFFALDERDQNILGRHYGIFDYPYTTMEEIGMIERLSVDGVTKAVKRIMKKLKDNLGELYAFRENWFAAQGLIANAKREAQNDLRFGYKSVVWCADEVIAQESALLTAWYELRNIGCGDGLDNEDELSHPPDSMDAEDDTAGASPPSLASAVERSVTEADAAEPCPSKVPQVDSGT